MVGGVGKVCYGVEQGAVKVKYGKSFHCLASIIHAKVVKAEEISN
jgi:hypothetical protein